MKPDQLKELQHQLTGILTDNQDVRESCATDDGIVAVVPAAVAYPAGTQDVQALAAWAAAGAGSDGAGSGPGSGKAPLSLVGRGNGLGRSGGALGDGVAVVFSAHLNKLVRLAKTSVTVQAGMSFGELQQILRSHSRYLPAAPAGSQSATVGGVVAENAVGAGGVKYGPIAAWVKGLRVVLDDGSVITTSRLSRWELNRKKGLVTREGDIYRGIDGLLQDHKALVRENRVRTTKNSAGYRLEAIKRRDGSFDLSQLMIGAQGTLGLITEVTLATAAYEPHRALLLASFDDLEKAGEAIVKLRQLGPSALELLDGRLVELLRQRHPDAVAKLVGGQPVQALLLVEFDHHSHLRQNLVRRRAARMLGKRAAACRSIGEPAEQEQLWTLWRQAAATVWLEGAAASAPPLPAIEGSCIPVQHIPEFLADVAKLLHRHKLGAAVWGHAGDGIFYLQPALDLGTTKSRKALVKLLDEFYGLVIKLGGSISGGQGDGWLRAPYLEKQVGGDMYHVFGQVKTICDPHGIFNPQIKLGVTKKNLEARLRHEYSRKQGHEQLPEL